MSEGQAVTGQFDASTRAIMPSGDVLSLHMLRHGEVAGFRERRVRGHDDTPLSERGLEQHEALAEWLARVEEKPDVIVSSDLSRCADLARRCGERLGIEPVYTDRLREQDMGEWEGKTWADLTRQDGAAVTAWWNDYVDARPPGGESFRDLSRRVHAYWASQVPRWTGRRVLLVTHIGVLRTLLCSFLGVKLGEALRFAPSAASHSSLLLAEAGAVVNALGERPWVSAREVGDPSRAASTQTRRVTTASVDGPPRIAMCGSAGVGKSTLGRRLADALDLPYLDETMRERLRAGLDIHHLDHDGMRALLVELWEEQCERERACPDGFVTDRSPIDYATFWLHYHLHHDRDDTEAWMEKTLARLPELSAIVLLPWGVLPLVDDGVRSTNRWAQFMFHGMVDAMATRSAEMGQLLRMPAFAELDKRLEWALAQLATRGARVPR